MLEGYFKRPARARGKGRSRTSKNAPSFPQNNLTHIVRKLGGDANTENLFGAGIVKLSRKSRYFLMQEILRPAHGDLPDLDVLCIFLFGRTHF